MSELLFAEDFSSAPNVYNLSPAKASGAFGYALPLANSARWNMLALMSPSRSFNAFRVS